MSGKVAHKGICITNAPSLWNRLATSASVSGFKVDYGIDQTSTYIFYRLRGTHNGISIKFFFPSIIINEIVNRILFIFFLLFWKGWVAIGIGNQMIGADIAMLLKPAGTLIIKDKKATAKSAPPDDTS